MCGEKTIEYYYCFALYDCHEHAISFRNPCAVAGDRSCPNTDMMGEPVLMDMKSIICSKCTSLGREQPPPPPPPHDDEDFVVDLYGDEAGNEEHPVQLWVDLYGDENTREEQATPLAVLQAQFALHSPVSKLIESIEVKLWGRTLRELEEEGARLAGELDMKL